MLVHKQALWVAQAGASKSVLCTGSRTISMWMITSMKCSYKQTCFSVTVIRKTFLGPAGERTRGAKWSVFSNVISKQRIWTVLGHWILKIVQEILIPFIVGRQFLLYSTQCSPSCQASICYLLHSSISEAASDHFSFLCCDIMPVQSIAASASPLQFGSSLFHFSNDAM